jgi:AraC-like DNA-binding protein
MSEIIKHERLKFAPSQHINVNLHTVKDFHPLHWHSYFEIEIILTGKGKYILNDVEYDIEKHNVFLLTSTDFHYLKIDEEATLLNISFDETMTDEKDMASLILNNIARAYEFDGDDYARIVKAAELLRHEYDINGDCQKSLLRYVVRSLFRKNTDMPDTRSDVGHLVGIKRAIIFLELHFREAITLEQVAEQAGYNPSYFSKLFKQITGESYIEVLTKYRLGYARTLLANGFSVTEACFASGFGSVSRFFEVFRGKYGISPQDYKKRVN